jgi:hypothetical protein
MMGLDAAVVIVFMFKGLMNYLYGRWAEIYKAAKWWMKGVTIGKTSGLDEREKREGRE